MRPCPAGAREQAGFSILEALIAASLLLLALALAIGLLVESGRRAERAAKEARRPVVELALELLRADLRAASGTLGTDTTPSYEPLVLVGHPAGEVVWRRDGEDLWREVEDTDGRPQGRFMLPNVLSLRWWRDRGAVRVELLLREESFAGVRQGAARADVVRSRVVKRELFVVPRNRSRSAF